MDKRQERALFQGNSEHINIQVCGTLQYPAAMCRSVWVFDSIAPTDHCAAFVLSVSLTVTHIHKGQLSVQIFT